MNQPARVLLALSGLCLVLVSVISADFDDTITAREVEQTVRDIETAVAREFPLVTRVYVRPLDPRDAA